MNKIYEITIKTLEKSTHTYIHFNIDSIKKWVNQIDVKYYNIDWTINEYKREGYTKESKELLSNYGNSHPVNAGAYLWDSLDEESENQDSINDELVKYLNS